MDTSQEEAFVRAFIMPDRRDRCLQILANPRKRGKVLGLLYHTLDFIPARATPNASRDHNPDFVEKTLRQKGAGPTCYLLSSDPEMDQHEMPLREALDTLISQDGVAVACCVSGRLAYYKAEHEQYLLERPPVATP